MLYVFILQLLLQYAFVVIIIVIVAPFNVVNIVLLDVAFLMLHNLILHGFNVSLCDIPFFSVALMLHQLRFQ